MAADQVNEGGEDVLRAGLACAKAPWQGEPATTEAPVADTALILCPSTICFLQRSNQFLKLPCLYFYLLLYSPH